jgi:MoxR-like ATPase
MSTNELATRLVKIENEMNGWALEREDIVHCIILARIAQRMNTIQVGPPGTAKSMVVEMFARHITGGRFFMSGSISPTTDPSALFGPVDIKAIVEDGVARHVTTGMLPDADDAFLDEILNASDATLQALHDALLGFFKNGRERLPIPLRCVHSGSNKFATEATQAMFDRFQFRFCVEPLVHKDSREKMLANVLSQGQYSPTTFVTVDELDRAHNHASMLAFEPEAFEALLAIRDELFDGAQEHGGIYISDRRLAACLPACQAEAWLSGHMTVQVQDLHILQHMLWTNPDDIEFVTKAVLRRANPQVLLMGEINKELGEQTRRVRLIESSTEDRIHRHTQAMEVYQTCTKLKQKSAGMRATANPANLRRINTILERLTTLQNSIKKILGIDSDFPM